MSEFIVIPGSEVTKIINSFKDQIGEIEICFGTNEEFIFSDGNELLNQISIREINDNEFMVLDLLFGGKFGECNVFNYMFN